MHRQAASGTITQDQGGIIAFLSNPASYHPRPDSVGVIETHGAFVFLAGDQAIKIKRAIRFPFMDFSTLEKRRRACHREIEINSPGAPEIYRRVLPITRKPGGELAFGGDGKTVEWAVLMHRFDQDALLDRMADKGVLGTDLMPSLAKKITGFHKHAVIHTEFDAKATLARVIRENQAVFEEFPEIIDPEHAAALGKKSVAMLKSLTPLIKERRENGHIRRCHGDLHLRNIVTINNRPVLFDAIEFDEAIAIVDILNDLSFLLMDLCHRQLNRHANIILNHWLNGMDDTAQYEGLALLPLFLSTRAAIRAKVAACLSKRGKGEEKTGSITDTRDFFTVAENFLTPDRPRLIAIGGISGSGKTTLARALAPGTAPCPGAVHLRSDVIRKMLFGYDETRTLPESAYSLEITEKVYKIMLERTGAALSAGSSVVADAVHARPAERQAIEQTARKFNASFNGLWLEAPPETLFDRVDHRQPDASDADATIVRRQLGYDIGDISWDTIQAGASQDEVIIQALKTLGQNVPLT